MFQFLELWAKIVAYLKSLFDFLPKILAAFGLGIMAGLSDVLVNGNNAFTARMFTAVVEANEGKSVVFSAFSVLIPLAQLSLVTVGNSHDELLQAIGMPNDSATILQFYELNHQLQEVKGVELRMASSIYVANVAKLSASFQLMTENIFDSQVQTVDFTQNVQTAAEINSWVESQTNSRIRDLVNPDDFDKNTRAVLVNAIYFQGKWKHKFSPEETRDSPFHVSKSHVVQIPTMHIERNYMYGENKELDAQLLRMPYSGGEASMLVILPKQIDGLAGLVEKLRDPRAIERATQDMQEKTVAVHLPKFKIETSTDLKKILKKLGVSKIFKEKEAQMTKLFENSIDDFYVDTAIQKAFIEVNEDGAEAAAANVFEIVMYSYPPQTRPKVFQADKPFYLEIEAAGIRIFSAVFTNL